MSEMVDKIAMAIRDNIQASLPDGVSVDYQYAARAAIEAMREPTQAMIDAASADEGVKDLDGAVQFAAIHGYRLNYVDGKPPLIRAYNAMIDAALSEVEG